MQIVKFKIIINDTQRYLLLECDLRNTIQKMYSKILLSYKSLSCRISRFSLLHRRI